MSNRVDGQKGFRTEDLRWVPVWTSIGAFVLGSFLAVLVVLGVNVFVNVLLVLAAAGLHAVLFVTAATLLVEGLGALGAFGLHRITDLRRWHFALLAAVAAVAVLGCYFVDRLVRRSGLNGWSVAGYWAIVAAVCLVAAVFTFHVLRTDSDQFQVPALSALFGLLGFVAGSAVVGLLIGVAAWSRNRDPSEGPDLSALPEITVAGQYVALGDSYSAGEGLRPFDPFTTSDHAHLGNGCHRSQLAYSRLLRFVAPVPAVRFAACSGAVTFDVLHPFRIGRGGGPDGRAVTVPPQVAGTHEDVGLVTITIGGNDVVFSKVVVHCFLRSACLDKTFDAPDDDPMRGLDLPDDQPLASWAEAAMGVVDQKVAVLYPQLRAAYPKARIVVVGYPYLFPDSGASIWRLDVCQSILRRFSRGERLEIRGLQDRLNQLLYRNALDAGLEFVSPAAGWDGHEPCGRHEQYTNSIKPFIQFDSFRDFVDGGTFHPNAAGQRELARLVTCYLVTNPTPPARDPSGPPPGSVQRPVTC